MVELLVATPLSFLFHCERTDMYVLRGERFQRKTEAWSLVSWREITLCIESVSRKCLNSLYFYREYRILLDRA